MNMKIERSYSLDDILIRPKVSELATRREVDLTTNIGASGEVMEHPMISAAMNTVTEWKMANEMWLTGGFGILHRYMSDEERMKQLDRIRGECGMAIATNDYKFVEQVMEDGLCKYFVFDVAHGHMEKAMIFGEWMGEKWNTDEYTLIGGNITERDALIDLASSGFDGARIGLGEGSVCTTRQVSGVGNPLASCLMELNEVRNRDFEWFRLIVDGGVENTGDIVKCLALGADGIISGYFFLQAKERPMEEYYGMASKTAMQARDYEDSIHMIAPEGKENIGRDYYAFRPVKDIIEETINGIKIGFSYVGARNITELRNKADFVVIN